MSNPTPAAVPRPVARGPCRWPAGPAVVPPTGPAGIGRVPVSTQALILNLARRGWSVRRIAVGMHMDWATVARCLDAWGVARNRRGERA